MRHLFFLLLLVFSYDSLKAQRSLIVERVDSLIALTQYPQALEFLNRQIQAAPDKKSRALLLNKKCEVQILQGHLDHAEATLQIIEPVQDDYYDAITLTMRGYLFLNKGRYDLSLEHLQQALRKFQTSGRQNSFEGARCLSTLGLLYGTTRKYSQAEESHRVALQIREALFGAESEAVAASNNDLGMIYLETDPDQALAYFEKAIATYRKIHGDHHPKIAIANTNMGIAYRKLDLLGDAIQNFEEAAKIWERIYPEGHPNQALVLSFLGQTYRQLNDTKSAQAFFDRALALYKKAYGDKHPDIAKTYFEIGVLQLGQQKYDAAIRLFQQSLIVNSPQFESDDIRKNPLRNDYYNGLGLLYSLRYKAQALESRYFGASLKLDDLLLALATLHVCDSLIDDIRYQSTSESDKIALGEIGNEVYEDGVRIAHAVSEMTLNYKKYSEDAFYFAEKSKSAVLQESIADAQALSFAGIPEALLEEEKNLKATLTFLNQKLSLKPSGEEEKYLREALFHLNAEYHAFKKKLEQDYPDYFHLKFSQQAPSVVEVQKRLDDHTALVSYFVAERNSRLYQFLITKKRFTIKHFALPSDFDRLLKGFNNSLYYSEFNTYRETSTVLAKVLIPKLPASVQQVIIVPSGRLSTVPFEALPLRMKSPAHFSDVDFLISRYAMSYEFSTGLFLQKNSQMQRPAQPSIFLCAPIEFSPDTFLPSLPGSEQEVTTIAGLFSPRSQTLTRSKATETEVKASDLSKYDFLHFATHGVVDEINPSLSRIFLNAGESDDGDLYSGEIYSLNLKSELAVLSACQTGLGKLSKGEGVIGLSRALTFAGTKNIVVSYWRVADQSTSVLMAEFYKILLANESISFSGALREAKRKLIQNSDYQAPYYWAPVVLIGR
jgi:CHAT domain-containing protein